MSDGGATFRWNGAAYLAHVRAAVPKALALAGEEIRNQMKVNLSGPSPSKPGGFPGADTGTLSRSIFNEGVTPFQRRIGTRTPQGRWMELGATVRPKRVKALPVPLNYKAKRMLRTLGVANGSRVSLRTRNLIVVKMGKTTILTERTAGGKASKAKDAARFVLRKKVVILPRPWCYRSAAMARGAAQARFASEMQRAMQAGLRAGVA